MRLSILGVQRESGGKNKCKLNDLAQANITAIIVRWRAHAGPVAKFIDRDGDNKYLRKGEWSERHAIV